jgi:2'-5' RNA ligase
VKGGDGLSGLARATDDATAALGVAKEERAYSPHLTLARIAKPGRLPGLLSAVAALPSLEFGAFTADRFFLYQSQTSPAGSVYTKLAEFPLAK